MSDDPTTSVPPITPAPGPTAPVPGAPVPPTLEPVRVTPPAPRRSSSGRWLNILLGVAVAVAIGGVAFAVGRTTAPVSAAAAGFGRGNFPGGTGPGGGSFDPNASFVPGQGRFGGGFGLGGGGITINGKVESVTGGTMTITTASGQTVDVTLDGDTAYHQQTPATASDVTAGSSVAVQVSGGFGRGNGNGNGNGGTGGNGGNGAATAPTITATDVTVIP